MSDFEQVSCWLQQAQADLQAALAKGDEHCECHRRYWFQQSYEKAIKAYGMLRFTASSPNDENDFVKLFLRHHSPLAELDSANAPSKVIWAIQRDIRVFVNRLSSAQVLHQIDGTKPRLDPAAISYRYPFRRSLEEDYISPSIFDDWDGYQGNAKKVERALKELLAAVNEELRIRRHAPK